MAEIKPFIGGMATRGPTIFDDFDTYGPQALVGRTAPGGSVWQSSGNGAVYATVTNAKLTSNNNCYNYLPPAPTVANPTGVVRQACRFSFTPVANTNGNRSSAKVVLLAVQTAGSISGKLFHLQISADSYTMQASLSGPSGLGGGFGFGNWKVPLLTDGTQYEVAVEYDYSAHTYTIYGPDGQIYTGTNNAIGGSFTDSNSTTGTIGPNDLTVPAWQIVGDTAAYNVYYHMVSTGPMVNDRHRLAPAGMAAALYGSGITQRQPFSVTFAGGSNDWFRLVQGKLFNTGTISGYAVAGRLRFDALDASGNYYNSWEIDCTGLAGGGFTAPNPVLTQKHGIRMIAPNDAVTQARLSTNILTSPYSSLDIFVPASPTAPITITGEFVGYGTVLQVPVKGATNIQANTALAATLNFTNG